MIFFSPSMPKLDLLIKINSSYFSSGCNCVVPVANSVDSWIIPEDLPEDKWRPLPLFLCVLPISREEINPPFNWFLYIFKGVCVYA